MTLQHGLGLSLVGRDSVEPTSFPRAPRTMEKPGLDGVSPYQAPLSDRKIARISKVSVEFR